MRNLRTIKGIIILLLMAGLAQAQEKPKLTIALVPEKNIFLVRRQHEALVDYLSRKLNIDIKLKFLSGYGQITDEFIKKNVEAGFFGSVSYGITRARTPIEPIARPVMPDGSSTYSGYLFVRKDSLIRDVAQMKGKRLALVDKRTFAGYIFPLVYFKERGVDNLEDYFSRIYFTGSHDASAWSVYIGEADVGAGKNHVFNKLAEENPDFKAQMLILAESGPEPQNVLAVAADFNPQLREKLKKAILDLDKTKEGRKVLEEFGAVRFIETQDKDYALLYQVMRDLNIDLKSYPYK